MKTCIVIDGFYAEELVDGEPKSVPRHKGDELELPDDVADRYSGSGLVEIVSHDGTPVGYGACCGGHG